MRLITLLQLDNGAVSFCRLISPIGKPVVWVFMSADFCNLDVVREKSHLL